MELLILGIGAAIGFFAGRRKGGPPSSTMSADSIGVARKKSEYDLKHFVPDLQGYTKELITNFGSDFLRCAPIVYPALTSDDRISYAKGIVRIAARRYGVQIQNLGIRFARKSVGREAGSLRQVGDRFFLDVLELYKDNDVALHAIIAHEMAHFALAKKSLRIEDKQKNEELTDALTVLAGFGPIVLQAYYTEINVQNERVEACAIFGLGYLHPSALAYLTLIQAEVSGVRGKLDEKFDSPWMTEPRVLWQQLSERQRSTENASGLTACLICSELLAPPDPGTSQMTTCRLCRYTQYYPLQTPKTESPPDR
ncbi:MAG TPA: hypothetical protein VES88_00945 [Gemmatimonadaceae bacterium]|nr:hypothetical protein [Gemmatimonadaceae bacterium]